MARFSACIEMLFTEYAPPERAGAAKKSGFTAVEIWQWHRWRPAELKDMALPTVLALTSSTDGRVRDEFARIGMYSRQSPALYAEMVHESVEALAPSGLRVLCAPPMQRIADASPEEHEENMAECLRAAAPIARRYGVRLAIEPLNLQVDHAGCYLTGSAQAFRIVRSAGEGGVLFDIYHQQITEGNLISNITSGIDTICHFHVADVPGRHEPGTGEINFAGILSVIDKYGFSGYVGCEFRPTSDTATACLGVPGLRP